MSSCGQPPFIIELISFSSNHKWKQMWLFAVTSYSSKNLEGEEEEVSDVHRRIWRWLSSWEHLLTYNEQEIQFKPGHSVLDQFLN